MRTYRPRLTFLLLALSIVSLTAGCGIFALSRYRSGGSSVRKLAAVSGGPVAYTVTEVAAPGETITVTGGRFDPEAKVWIAPVLSNGSINTGSAQEMSRNNASDITIQATVPGGLAAGLWAVWVENENGSKTAELLVNKARITTTDSVEVANGMALSIYGKNFLPPQGASGTPTVSLTDGTTTLTATVTYSDAYKLVANVASGIVNGTVYTLKVSNGLGGATGQDTGPATLTGRAAGADPFELGVTWGADFTAIAANVFNVKNDVRLTSFAVGDGSTNDLPALNAAIAKANQLGGGTVYLPAGTYKVVDTGYTTVRLLSNVVLKGAGEGVTTITYGETPDEQSAAIEFNGGISKSGIYGITLQNLNTSPATANVAIRSYESGHTGYNKLFISRVTSNQEAGGYINMIKVTDLVTRHLTVNTIRTGFRYTLNKRAIMRDSTINFGLGRNLFATSEDSIIEDSAVIRDGTVNSPWKAESGGIEYGFNTRSVIRNNDVRIINVPDDIGNNDGEMIMAQDSQYGWSVFGNVGSVSGTTLTDPTKSWTDTTFQPFNFFLPGHMIFITSGAARGQWRTITGHTATTLTLDRPWDIDPAPGDKYTMSVWNLNRMLVIGNHVEGGSWGVQAYAGAYDLVFADNDLLNTGGVDFRGTDRFADVTSTIPCSEGDTLTPCKKQHVLWNSYVLNNTVESTDGRTASSIIVWDQNAETYVSGGPNPYFGKYLRSLTLYANTIRHNTVTPYSTPKPQDGIRFYAQLGGYSNFSPYFEAILGTVIEGNTMNTGATYTFGGGIGQSTVKGTGLTVTSPCIKLQLDRRQGMVTQHAEVSFKKRSSGDYIARDDEVTIGTDGTLTFSSPIVGSMLSQNPGAYDIWIKAPGYLARTISNVTFPITGCAQLASGQTAKAGDVALDDNEVGLLDVTATIDAFAGGSGALPNMVNRTMGGTAELLDVTRTIDLFATGATGDAR